jgi:hypothetical protein
MLSVLLACGLSLSAGAAEDPANSKLLKQCESAKGEVKRECEAVAKKMIKDEAGQERDDTTSQEVTHSSPAMSTPAEAKKDEAAKRKERARQEQEKEKQQ